MVQVSFGIEFLFFVLWAVQHRYTHTGRQKKNVRYSPRGYRPLCPCGTGSFSQAYLLSLNSIFYLFLFSNFLTFWTLNFEPECCIHWHYNQAGRQSMRRAVAPQWSLPGLSRGARLITGGAKDLTGSCPVRGELAQLHPDNETEVCVIRVRRAATWTRNQCVKQIATCTYLVLLWPTSTRHLDKHSITRTPTPRVMSPGSR